MSEDRCTWSQDDHDGDCYSTGCGSNFILNEDTPDANGFSFCCYCGLPLKQKLYIYDEENV